ncbi:aldo/keto reductase family domain-containing protein [Trichoderma breve]|uniref:Aldo/keto reductase family domain-containing protein n=1 Tax=Trichoderma breve TaxID=2034170 RepID=A0A9W9EAI6_9HYPO|nr:aldo/keto reductase family domain-containing protein [Trichoderma breve]KAJ4863124.1 aldo/keto reductase family domain-containing protein [Trichoderma breve]
MSQASKPRVILGLMTFGPNENDGARITDLDTFNKALDVLQARGYNEVDTARVYVGGTQEDFTRQANWKKRGLTLATKVKYPAQLGDNTAEKVVESVEKSLKELDTDSVDILYLHRPDRGVPFAETLEAVDRLHKAGKFKKLGVSNFTAFEVAEVVMTCKYNGWIRPTIYQGMYNAITRNIEAELFVACRRYGLDIVVYNPLAGGLFSGKIKSQDLLPETGRYSGNTAIANTYRSRYFRDSTFESLKVVEEAAEKAGLTLIEIAMRWVVHHSGLKIKDGNDGIIIGVSSIAQLENNLDNAEKGPLPEEVVKALDEAWAISKAESTNYWHGDLEYTYDPIKVLFGEGAK